MPSSTSMWLGPLPNHTAAMPCARAQTAAGAGQSSRAASQKLEIELAGQAPSSQVVWIQVLQVLPTFPLSPWNRVGTLNSKHQHKPQRAVSWTHKRGADVFANTAAVSKHTLCSSQAGPATSCCSSCLPYTSPCPMPQQRTALGEPEEPRECEPTNQVT